MNHPIQSLVEKTPEQRDAGERCSVAAGSASSPRTSAALSATLESCGWLKREVHGPLVDLCRDMERENEQLRRYCGCLEDQLDEFGLKAAQRAAGLDEPNNRDVPTLG